MFVTNSLSGGGAERATNILVNALKNSGIQVSLVAINDGQRDLIEPTCEVFELHREWKGGLVSVFNAYIGIQKAIWRWRPDFLVLNCDRHKKTLNENVIILYSKYFLYKAFC